MDKTNPMKEPPNENLKKWFLFFIQLHLQLLVKFKIRMTFDYFFARTRQTVKFEVSHHNAMLKIQYCTLIVKSQLKSE